MVPVKIYRTLFQKKKIYRTQFEEEIKNKMGDAGIIYLSNFSDAILAALIIWGLGTHFTTRFGSALMGEWILISLTMKKVDEKVSD